MTDKDQDAEILEREQADLWAMSYGFSDAAEMKQWGEQAEREYLAERQAKKDATT